MMSPLIVTQLHRDGITPGSAGVAMVIHRCYGDGGFEVRGDGFLQVGLAQRRECFADADAAEAVEGVHEVA